MTRRRTGTERERESRAGAGEAGQATREMGKMIVTGGVRFGGPITVKTPDAFC